MEETLSRLQRDDRNNHERQAARLRALALNATTAAVKARLLGEADQYERIARGEPVLPAVDDE